MTSSPKDSRLMALLDSAYAVSEDSDAVETLFDHANGYLFDPETGWRKAADLPDTCVLDPTITRHSARLVRLFEQFQGTNRAEDALSDRMRETAYARLLISADGRVAWINDATDALFPDMRGKMIEDMALTRPSLLALRAALKSVREGVKPQNNILSLVRETDGKPCFAMCHVTLPNVAGFSDPMLAVALSHIDWTDMLLDQVGSALGLSTREAQVLRGALAGQSQAQIAASAGRSVETIKAQSKAILQKTGLPRMSDVLVLASSVAYLTPNNPAPVEPTSDDSIILPVTGDRSVQYRRFGAPNGTPFLFVHGLQTGPFFPPAMDRAMAKAGIRIIAPSRPWFGATSPSSTDAAFNTEVITDALAVLDAEGIKDVIVIAHQGGTSHAFRIAAALGERLNGMVMIDAGIPIDDTYVSAMNRQTRMAAIATRYTPAVMEMIVSIGSRAFLKKGPRSYFNSFFRNDPVDLASLDNPEIYPSIEAGGLHMIAQGTHAFMLDGAAAMADWTADYQAVRCRAEWIHGAHCPVMGAKFIDQYVRETTNNPVTIVPDAGFHLIYDRPDLILDLLTRTATWRA